MTLLAIGTVFYLDIDAWAISAIAVVTTTACLVRPDLPARVPAIAHRLAFPVIVAFFLGDLWWKTELLPAMVRLDIFLLLYRGINYRQRRDELQIIVLGLFLVIVAGVLTVSIAFAAQILAFVACALALLFLLTLTDTMKVPAPAPEPGRVPGWAVRTDWRMLFQRVRAATDIRVIIAGAVLFAGVVGISVLLFLAIPRFQFDNGLFLERFIFRKARTGFNDSIKFGDITEIVQDTSIALSVDVSEKSAVPLVPYWRMMVLDDYHDSKFMFSKKLRGELGADTTSSRVQVRPRYYSTHPATWVFYLESGVSQYLPLLGRFGELHFRETQSFRFSEALAIVALNSEPASMMAYQVDNMETGPLLPDAIFSSALKVVEEERTPAESRPAVTPTSPGGITEGVRKYHEALVKAELQIQLSPDDVQTLLRTVGDVQQTEPSAGAARLLPVPRAGTKRSHTSDFAQRVITWLRRNHHYSISPNIPRGAGDPLVRWLTSQESGHCELFAGSVVLLARAAGIPARVVTGFKGGTWNSYSSNLTIRNSDAHAWAELFDPAAGAWMRVDALGEPEYTVDAGPSAAAAREARTERGWSARLESLRVFWYRRIVSFDQQSQVETIRAVKQATENTGTRIRDILKSTIDNIVAFIRGPWNLRRVVGVVAFLAAGIGLTWAWREFGAGFWKELWKPAAGRRDDPVRREAGRWLGRLMARELTSVDVVPVREELQRLRFGSRETWPPPEQVFRRARKVWRRRGRR